MDYEIGVHDKQLCIIDHWISDFSKPEQYRNWWPLGISAKDYPEWIGMKARSFGGSTYELYDNGRRFRLELVNGGQTKAVFLEVRPIKKPRWGKSYANGEWRRY